MSERRHGIEPVRVPVPPPPPPQPPTRNELAEVIRQMARTGELQPLIQKMIRTGELRVRVNSSRVVAG